MNYIEGIFMMVESMYKPPSDKEPFVYVTKAGDTFSASHHKVTIKPKGGDKSTFFGSEAWHREPAKEIFDEISLEYSKVESQRYALFRENKTNKTKTWTT